MEAHDLDAFGMSLRAVSFQGAGHALTGSLRQDAFAAHACEDWLVVAVADGIGSCPHSHIGAAAAAAEVCAAITENGDLAHNAAELMRLADIACREAAARYDLPENDVATTLTVAAVAAQRQDDGSRHVLVHAVGDSPALTLSTDGTWTYLTVEDDAPSNVVRQWLPGQSAEPFTIGFGLPAGHLLVLASDGFTTPLGDGSGLLGQDLQQRWTDAPRALIDFVVDIAFDAYHDDKTVAAIWNSTHTATPNTEQLDQQEESSE